MPNYHVTEAGSARSVGTTDRAPGFYAATETDAECTVAPGLFVEARLRALGEEHTDGAIADAVRAWARGRDVHVG